MRYCKKDNGITIVALVITIIVLLILAGVTIVMVVRNNDILTKTKDNKEENSKQEAVEAMNSKLYDITIQYDSIDANISPLQFLVNKLCEDPEIEYVIKDSEDTPSKDKIDVTEYSSIFTKLKKYPYKFEINGEFKIITIDGVKNNVEADDDGIIAGTNIEKAIEYGEDIPISQLFPSVENPSVMYKGNEITSTKDLPAGEWTLRHNKTTNTINIIEANTVEDLSGNNHTLYLQNHTSIEKDENGDYYLSFDGVDDYAQIKELEASINWEDGFKAEFEAEWNAFNKYSRIFDFGAGQNNNILFGNSKFKEATLSIGVHGSNGTSDIDLIGITKDKKEKFTINYEKISNSDYMITSTKDDGTSTSIKSTINLVNTLRNANYLGKSNWNGDGYLNGKIYSLKVSEADGDVIVNYDINDFMKNYDMKTIKIIGEGYSNHIVDLSGNGYKLSLRNGANLLKDDENKYYINFDGADDYALVDKLGENINWSDGFKVEFEAEWDAFNSYSRIFDFGNQRNDNILLGNSGSGNRYLSIGLHGNNGNKDISLIEILGNKKEKYTVEYKKNKENDYTITTKKDDGSTSTASSTINLRNTTRVTNYLGKSNWNDPAFKGRIYSLKITDASGKVILYYDINKWIEMSK